MNPKRALLALLLANIIIQTGSGIKERQAPRPSRYVAVALVFLILGTISDTIPRASKTAVVFAGLFTLTVALRVVAGKPFGVSVAPAPETSSPGGALGTGVGAAAVGPIADYWQGLKEDYKEGKNGNQKNTRGRRVGKDKSKDKKLAI